MLYNISINQQKAVELKLTANEAFVLHGILTLCGRNGIEHHDTNGLRYYWLSKNLLCQQLPLLQLKADSMYRIVKTLRDKGFIEMLESKHIQEFYRTTPLADSLLMTVGKFSDLSDKTGVAVGKKSEQQSENFPTIIVKKDNNKENAPNFANLPLSVEFENGQKESGKRVKVKAFDLDSYKPSVTISPALWEQVVKPALEYRLQLQKEQTTATDRKKYNLTERVVHGCENVARDLVNTYGLEKVKYYVQRAIRDGITWVSLLTTDEYVKRKIKEYAFEIEQATHLDGLQAIEARDKMPAFALEDVQKIYKNFQEFCKKELPKATPLTVAQFNAFFFGAKVERAIFHFATHKTYLTRIKQAIEKKKTETKGFYNGTIADVIKALLESQE